MLRHREKSGFSVIELMIAVAIGSVLLAIAIPSYQKRIFDAREVDMIKQGREAYRDQMRVKGTVGEFTECISGCSQDFNLIYQPDPNTKVNLITGQNLFPSLPGAKFELTTDQYPKVLPKVNSFGTIWNEATQKKDRMMMGLEADLLGDHSTLHVIALDEKGNLYTLCDQWSGTKNADVYTSLFGRGGIQCAQSAGLTVGDPGDSGEGSGNECEGDGCGL